jgi:endonuclease/exonuclease/phosphatase family metal-dependent hydrolase
MGVIFKVVTLNILNDPSRWPERRSLIATGLAELEPDLIALQEVALPENNARWLADELGGYSVYLCPKTGNKHDKEGIAILSRLTVKREATLDLQSQHRVAQFVQVNLASCSLTFVNAHLYWWPGESVERVKQIRLMLDWLSDLSGMAIVVCGDFNGTPGSTAIQLMRQRFASAYAARHGREPDYTCPTPLTRIGRVRFRDIYRGIGKFVLNLVTNHKVGPWRGTLDYVFANEQVRVVDCDVVFNHPALHEPTLYPSDHFGLAATLQTNRLDRVK